MASKELDREDVAVMWIMHTSKGTFDFGYKMGEAPEANGDKPSWMGDFKRKWDSPTDPVTFEFTLTDESYIQDAMNFLYNGPVNGIQYPAGGE